MIATVKLTNHRVWAREASAPEQNTASLRRKLGQHVDITFTTADVEASNKTFESIMQDDGFATRRSRLATTPHLTLGGGSVARQVCYRYHLGP